jgi:hypothetical protein
VTGHHGRWALAHAAVAVALTAPLAWQLDRVPIGREPVATVTLFNLWSLRWTGQRAAHLFAGWWDAPIYWPHRGMYAGSELQPVTGAMHALLSLPAGPVAGYGLVLLVTLTLNGIAGAALARRLGAAAVPAALAGVLVQALPFVHRQLGVVQLLALWPLLAAVTCLLAWAEVPGPLHAVLGALSLAAAVGTCGVHGALFALSAGPAAVLLVRRDWWRDRRRAGNLLAAAATLAALALPLVVGQQRRLAGYHLLQASVVAGSATWPDLAPSGRWGPGWPLLLLGLAGAALSWRRRSTSLLVAFGSAAALAALGPNLSVVGWRPWLFLADHVRPIALLRAPFRATVLVQLALAALAASALQALWAHRRAVVRPVAPVATVVAVLTAGTGPGSLVDAPPAGSAWQRWLAGHRDGGAVAHLPFARSPLVASYQQTAAWMVQSLDHGHPLVNGLTTFEPADADDTRRRLNRFPDAASVDLLVGLGVAYVVADPVWLTPERADGAAEAGFVTVVADAGGVLLRVPTRGSAHGEEQPLVEVPPDDRGLPEAGAAGGGDVQGPVGPALPVAVGRKDLVALGQ